MDTQQQANVDQHRLSGRQSVLYRNSLEGLPVKPSQMKQALADLNTLFTGKKNMKNQLFDLVIMGCVSSLYYIGLYNSTQLKGNLLMITMTFGISEVIGIVSSPKLAAMFSIKKSITMSCLAIIALNLVAKYTDITENQLYVIFLFEAYSLGFLWNAVLFMQN